MASLEADTLHAALQRVCDAAPQTPALQCGHECLTRSAFMARVARVRGELQAQGVGTLSLVAWLGHNSVDMLATLAACSGLGAVFLPLNWRLTVAELAAITRHAGITHLLGTPELQALRDQLTSNVVFETSPVAGLAPGDLLLVYTSGTSGQPKGAVHTQHGVLANAAAAIEAQVLDAKTRTLAVLPTFHVGGLCIQTLPTLLAGGSVNLHSRFEPNAWFDDVARWRPNTSLLVPAIMRSLIAHPRWPSADLSALQFVNSGSQVVPLILIDAFHQRGVPITQVYGSTESGPVSIALRPSEAPQYPGWVGRAALGVMVRLSPEGEVMLRAPNLLRAYHRSALPAFDADGWFHTGDLAEQGAHGLYRILGRGSELIISGGENIHPAEVEELALSLPGVAECAVLGLPNERWGEVPVMAVVMHAQATWQADAWQTLVHNKLARFKHPRQVVVLAELPKTALGKVQKTVLSKAPCWQP